MGYQIGRVFISFVVAAILCYGVMTGIFKVPVSWKYVGLAGCGIVVLFRKDDFEDESEEWIVGGDGKIKKKFDPLKYKDYKYISSDKNTKIYMSDQGAIITTKIIDRPITLDEVVTIIASLTLFIISIIMIIQLVKSFF